MGKDALMPGKRNHAAKAGKRGGKNGGRHVGKTGKNFVKVGGARCVTITGLSVGKKVIGKKPHGKAQLEPSKRQKKALRAKTTKMVALAGKLAKEKGIDDSVTIVVDAKEGTIRSYDLNAAKRMITHATNNARCAILRAVHC